MDNNKEILKDNKKWAKRLFWFLFWHRALREYVHETGRDLYPEVGKYEWIERTILGRNPLHFLDSLFVWDYAEKGIEFWIELNEKWIRKWQEEVKHLEEEKNSRVVLLSEDC